MKAKNRAIAVERHTPQAGLWVLVALLFFVSTSCVAAAEPQEGGPNQANFGLSQEAPPTGTLDVIQVDLNAIEVAPPIQSAVTDCEKLSSPLPQLIDAADPALAAQALGLLVRENLVQVSLVIESEDVIADHVVQTSIIKDWTPGDGEICDSFSFEITGADEPGTVDFDMVLLGNGAELDRVSVHFTTVPEPATVLLLGLGGIELLRRRKA